MQYSRKLWGAMIIGAFAALPTRAQTISATPHDPFTLHPAWSLSELHPASWTPQLMDMGFLPDGRLAVLTMRVEKENTTGTPHKVDSLYILSNIGTGTPADVKVQLIAANLPEATGLCIVGGKIYVAEKTQLTEHTINPDGVSTTARKIADIPVDPSGQINFQEWNFGLMYKDGYFYTATGGCVRLGGKSCYDSLSQMKEPKRGGILKIKMSDGTSEILNGGLRAPNGLTWGPDSSFWVTDNQGSFLPAGKLIEVRAGRNYGYPNNANPFHDKPETPPSVWYPYQESGRSPTHPIFLQHGSYAGQMLSGDMCSGGIFRTFIEKVNGEWQGASFSFSGGFSAAVQKILEAPDGGLILGNLGRGDVANWGWLGKMYGLQKIMPKAGVTTFEMLAIRSRKDGMEIEFTKPIGAGSDQVSNYTASTAVMKPGPAYGEGNMQNRTNLTVSSVSVSDDKKRVFLQINGMTTGVVVTIKGIGVKSADGDTLYRPTGWYTLNAISPSSKFDPIVPVVSGVNKNAVPGLAETGADRIRLHQAGGFLRVEIPFEGGHAWTLRSLNGQALLADHSAGPREYALDASRFSPGLYVLEVRVAGMLLHKNVLMQAP